MIAIDRRSTSYPVVLPDRRMRDRPTPRRRFRRKPMVAALVVAAVAVLPALLYVFVRTEAAKTNYTILHLQRELTRLEGEHARLHAIASTLGSPQRIERIAVRELSMAPPRRHQLAAITIAPAIAAVPAPTPARSWRQRLAAWFGSGAAQANEPER